MGSDTERCLAELEWLAEPVEGEPRRGLANPDATRRPR
jgi:hypothetical protein